MASKRINLYLSKDVCDEAKMLSEKLGISVSSVVNNLLRRWISENYKRLRLTSSDSKPVVEPAELYNARRRFMLSFVRFQPHYQLRALENYLKGRPENINISYVTEIIEESEKLLKSARDLNMTEEEKVLEEIVKVGDKILEKLMNYAGE